MRRFAIFAVALVSASSFAVVLLRDEPAPSPAPVAGLRITDVQVKKSVTTLIDGDGVRVNDSVTELCPPLYEPC